MIPIPHPQTRIAGIVEGARNGLGTLLLVLFVPLLLTFVKCGTLLDDRKT